MMSGMSTKVRWGVLSTAAIGVKKVIPAMQKGEWSEVTAIASRDIHKAEAVAQALGIARAYGSHCQGLWILRRASGRPPD